MEKNYELVVANSKHQWRRTTLCQRSRVLGPINNINTLYDIVETVLNALFAAKDELQLTAQAHAHLLDDIFNLQRKFRKTPVVFNKPILEELKPALIIRDINRSVNYYSTDRINKTLTGYGHEASVMKLKRSILKLVANFAQINEDIQKYNQQFEKMVSYHKTLSVKAQKLKHQEPLMG